VARRSSECSPLACRVLNSAGSRQAAAGLVGRCGGSGPAPARAPARRGASSRAAWGSFEPEPCTSLDDGVQARSWMVPDNLSPHGGRGHRPGKDTARWRAPLAQVILQEVHLTSVCRDRLNRQEDERLALKNQGVVRIDSLKTLSGSWSHGQLTAGPTLVLGGTGRTGSLVARQTRPTRPEHGGTASRHGADAPFDWDNPAHARPRPRGRRPHLPRYPRPAGHLRSPGIRLPGSRRKPAGVRPRHLPQRQTAATKPRPRSTSGPSNSTS